MTDALRAEYERRYHEVLQPIATVLETIISDHLRNRPHIDRITARAKRPDRFLQKAVARDDSGAPRYHTPLVQIQDQLGARVIVFYLSDVAPMTTELLRYFRHIEVRELVPDSEWEFGYFGRHLILALPPEAVPNGIERQDAPRFFELQIKTLFQHAWSEAEHDLGYKASGTLSSDQKRRLAFTAAQAWGADRLFRELSQELTAGRA